MVKTDLNINRRARQVAPQTLFNLPVMTDALRAKGMRRRVCCKEKPLRKRRGAVLQNFT